MTLFQSLIISITQGITEFLPISSTGHINLLQHYFGFQPSLSFDIFLNTASLIAVLIYFRTKLDYFFGNLKYIIVGTIPAIVFGLVFKDQIEAIFSSVKTLPYEFIFTALILFSTKFFESSDKKLNYKNALIIGLFQALAIIPAISRSGSTIFASLLMGLSPLNAFNFSFSLLIPASIGALILDLRSISSTNSLSVINLVSFLVTVVVSYFSLSWLQKILVNRSIWKFGYYTLAVGLTLLFVL